MGVNWCTERGLGLTFNLSRYARALWDMPRKGNLHWISSETGQNSEYFWTGIWCYMSSSSNWVPNVKIRPPETATKIYSKEKCTPQGTDGLCASIHATSLSMVSVTHVNFTREFFACWRHYQKTIVDRVFSRSAGSCVQKENSEHSWGHRAQILPKLWTQGRQGEFAPLQPHYLHSSEGATETEPAVCTVAKHLPWEAVLGSSAQTLCWGIWKHLWTWSLI